MLRKLAQAVGLNQLVQPAAVDPPPKQCRIIQGPVAICAQLVLLLIVLSALFFKRHRERPRRAWNVWLLDISKQGISSGAGHICGMTIAILAHHSSGTASQCAWYFVVYLMDCTLGITLAILFLKLSTRLAKCYNQRLQSANREHHWTECLLESGNYGEPPSMRRWGIQVVGWVTCVVGARTSVGATVLLTIPIMHKLTKALDKGFAGHPDLLLFFVMVGCPMLMNVGQAWIQDQVLKWRHKRHLVRRDSSGEDQTTPLLQNAGELLIAPHNRSRSSERIPSLANSLNGKGSPSMHKASQSV